MPCSDKSSTSATASQGTWHFTQPQLQSGVRDHEKRCNKNLCLDTGQETEALRQGALPRPAACTRPCSWLTLTHSRDSLASDLCHGFAFTWWAADYGPVLDTVTRPALLSLSAHRGTVPVWVLSLPCLPCSPLEMGSTAVTEQLTLATRWHPGQGERGGKDGARDWDGRGRLLQKSDSSSCQRNAEYPK